MLNSCLTYPGFSSIFYFDRSFLSDYHAECIKNSKNFSLNISPVDVAVVREPSIEVSQSDSAGVLIPKTVLKFSASGNPIDIFGKVWGFRTLDGSCFVLNPDKHLPGTVERQIEFSGPTGKPPVWNYTVTVPEIPNKCRFF